MMDESCFWHYWPHGFILSAPLAITLLLGFTGPADNNSLLAFAFVIGALTLPGSLILLAIGFIAAFSGKSGETVALICLLLSVVNAHLMAMFYAFKFNRRAQ